MTIYNIRKNGPYEYDKFVLNIGQVHNLVKKMELRYGSDKIHDYVDYLDEIIKQITKDDSSMNILELRTTVSMKGIL